MRLSIAFFTLLSFQAFGQPNCNVFKYNGDSLQYQACKMAERFGQLYQFEGKAMAILDSAIAVCPYFAYAHYEKAVVYLKAGNFLLWDKYINNAVRLAPIDYLGNRASCRGKFFGDYAGAIDDINLLDSLTNYDIGYVHDAAYHLHSYRALCHKALGQYDKAIEVFESQVNSNKFEVGLFDYIHLGVCYLETSNIPKAIDAFKKQIEYNEMAEARFYLGKCYQRLNQEDASQLELNKAKQLFLSDQKMNDGFHTMEDEIFLEQILENLKGHN